MLQLPGHTTHRLQSLDAAFFKPLGLYYIQAQEKWLHINYGKIISQFHIKSLLLNEAYGRAATIGIAENAFKSLGIWPVNRYIFQDHHFIVSQSLNKSPKPKPNEQEIETEVECVNDSFLKVLLDISPIPKTTESSNSKWGRGAQKVV